MVFKEPTSPIKKALQKMGSSQLMLFALIGFNDFEESRRFHFFRGLDKIEYHKYFDSMYNLHRAKLKRKE